MTLSLKNKSFPITEPISLEDFLLEMGLAKNMGQARKMIGQGQVSITFERMVPKVSVVIKDNNFVVKPSYVSGE